MTKIKKMPLQEIGQNLNGVLAGFDEISPAYKDIRKTMNELSAAARSLRLMMDYLERHPQQDLYPEPNSSRQR